MRPYELLQSAVNIKIMYDLNRVNTFIAGVDKLKLHQDEQEMLRSFTPDDWIIILKWLHNKFICQKKYFKITTLLVLIISIFAAIALLACVNNFSIKLIGLLFISLVPNLSIYLCWHREYRYFNKIWNGEDSDHEEVFLSDAAIKAAIELFRLEKGQLLRVWLMVNCVRNREEMAF